jgi:methylmalonyl-CoA mutase N-terminal domain/subunit
MGTSPTLNTTSLSGIPFETFYNERDIEGSDYQAKLGDPGTFPFTRGIHADMYRGWLWTMRQFAGFGTASDTNARFRYLLSQGQTGLSVAFDMPTLMGFDSDHPSSMGEVGKCGVAVDSIEDMDELFAEIPVGEVSTSMTINCTAPIVFAMYLALAKRRGVPLSSLKGTLQNDMLKEFIAQKEWIYPIEPSLKLMIDIVEFCTNHVPLWNTISISGYHIREAGSTAVQELAFTLSDGLEYVKRAIGRGLGVDQFARRYSFFFNAHIDFFEEIAKYRAARRIWAREMKERYGVQDERSLWMRFHTQTAGCSLTAQQPHNNIVRTAIEALAAVLGGTQSLHTNSLDETYALPTEFAATLALRTQQVLAYETRVPSTGDPLGGSYFIESLTDEIEGRAMDYIRRIDEYGGMVPALEAGFPQKEIQEAACLYQKELNQGNRTIVGVNAFSSDEDESIPLLRVGRKQQEEQIRKLRELRARRSNATAQKGLDALKQAAEQGENLIPTLVLAVESLATLGEVAKALQEVYGKYREVSYI